MFFNQEIYENYFISKNTKGKSDNMCDKLKEIMGKTPEEILDITGQTDAVPVDISKVLSILNISEIPMDFKEVEEILEDEVKEKGAISGMVLLSGNDIGIFCNKYDSINRQRFTKAHELAHCCLDGDSLVSKHIEFRHELNSTDEKEIAANTYAGKLLIPEKSLIKVYEQLTIPALDSLSKIFHVSISVMRARLRLLQKNYFDTELNEMVILEEV